MLKIYGAPHSRAFRVIWLANEIGIPYEHVPVTFDPQTHSAKSLGTLRSIPTGACLPSTMMGS
jgi:glutathione S-transferase